MKGPVTIVLLMILLFACPLLPAQKTLMLGKIGTPRHYYFHRDDPLKIRLTSIDTLLKGRIWLITDSTVSVLGLRTYIAPLGDISYVYTHSWQARYIGVKMAEAGGVYFCIVALNHLFYHQRVLSRDMWIVPASFFALSGISFSFKQTRHRIGLHWKLKVLEMNIRR